MSQILVTNPIKSSFFNQQKINTTIIQFLNDNNNNNKNDKFEVFFEDILSNTDPYLRYIVGGIGCFFNLTNILFFFFSLIKDTPSKAHELIAYINISSLINTISYLLLFVINSTDEYNKTLCSIQGPMMFFSELNQILCLTIISFHIFNNINNRIDVISRDERIKNILFIFTSPLFITLIGIIFKIFGLNGHWCWIDSKFGNSYAFIFYFIIWCLMIIDLVLIIYSNVRLRNIETVNSVVFHEKENLIAYNNKIMIFPIILISCWVFPTINRIFGLYGKTVPILFLLHMIMNLLLGTLISTVSYLFLDWVKILKGAKNFFNCKWKKKPTYIKDEKNNILLSSSDFAN